MKTCCNCKQTLDETYFNKGKSRCKVCYKQYNKEYRKTPQYIAWRLKHAQTQIRKEQQAKYRAVKQQTSEYKNYQAKYRSLLSSKIDKAKSRIRYYEKHPEKLVDINHRRYATLVLKPTVLIRDNFTCQLCKTEHNKLVVHHIIPVNLDNSENSIKDLTNLISLCKSCHLIAHAYVWSKIDSQLANNFLTYTKSILNNI